MGKPQISHLMGVIQPPLEPRLTPTDNRRSVSVRTVTSSKELCEGLSAHNLASGLKSKQQSLAQPIPKTRTPQQRRQGLRTGRHVPRLNPRLTYHRHGLVSHQPCFQQSKQAPESPQGHLTAPSEPPHHDSTDHSKNQGVKQAHYQNASEWKHPRP